MHRNRSVCRAIDLHWRACVVREGARTRFMVHGQRRVPSAGDERTAVLLVNGVVDSDCIFCGAQCGYQNDAKASLAALWRLYRDIDKWRTTQIVFHTHRLIIRRILRAAIPGTHTLSAFLPRCVRARRVSVVSMFQSSRSASEPSIRT